jgi:hypothetical protein
MKQTHLEKAVKAFLKDEYDLKNVEVTLKIGSVNARKENLKRFEHDSTNDFDFDLLD